MANMDRALRMALKPQSEINVERIVNEMKNNALATSNWEQLVAAAPVALQYLGACFMAASSKGLDGVKVPKVPGAKIDRPLSLQANLVRCSRLGTSAFLAANKGMVEIYQKSALSENKVYDIVEVIGDRRSAAKQLPSQLQQLETSATECYQISSEIDRAFGEWLAFTTELYEACQEQSAVVAGEQQKSITDKAVAAQNVKDTSVMIASTTNAMTELGKTMETARDAFKKASESQPTGWEIIGQQLVSSLGQALSTGISSAVPALVENMNPMAKAKTAAEILAGLQKGKDTSAGTTTEPQAAASAADPGFVYVQKDLYLYNLLSPIMLSADGGVNWQAANPEDPSAGLSFISGMLAQSEAALNKQNSSGFAAVAYKKVLKDINGVLTEMQKASKDATSSMSSKLPAKDSEAVLKWQTTFQGAYRSVVALDVQAKSLPHNAVTSGPAIPDPSIELARIDAQTMQAKAVLSHAATQLETTAKTMESTTRVYGETQKTLSSQQQQLADLNETLTRLTSNVIKLEESKEILIRCIALIIDLKARIVELVRFFDTLAAVVKTVSQNLVGNWLETVKNAVTSGSTDPKAVLRVGQYSLEAAERTMILNGSITIASYFSFFADVANTWRQVSEQSIFPGIQLAESLSIPGGDAQAKKAKLDRWAAEAQENIKDECGKRRRDIQEGMAARVEEVKNLISYLPKDAVPLAAIDVANETAGLIENAQREAMKEESDKSVITIVSRRRQL